MNNLITVFMNYRINRLITYGTIIYEDTKFTRTVLKGYFTTYIENYYYGVFSTVESNSFTPDILDKEFLGVMEDMLDDYRVYELVASNEEYKNNRETIKELCHVCKTICLLDQIKIDEDNINNVLNSFLVDHDNIRHLIEGREKELQKALIETENMSKKLLGYNNEFFAIDSKRFENNKNFVLSYLSHNIKVLGDYKNSLVTRVFKEEKLDEKKLQCLIQKISLELLKDLLAKKPLKTYFIEFPDSVIKRGRIIKEINDYIDNPIFQKNVVIGVKYQTYLNQINAFSADYQFACIQDFSHINDIYKKVESIYNEGIFNYLIVNGYKEKEKDYFLKYENNGLEILLLEEE